MPSHSEVISDWNWAVSLAGKAAVWGNEPGSTVVEVDGGEVVGAVVAGAGAGGRTPR
jgi:hypothetical protein